MGGRPEAPYVIARAQGNKCTTHDTVDKVLMLCARQLKQEGVDPFMKFAGDRKRWKDDEQQEATAFRNFAYMVRDDIARHVAKPMFNKGRDAGAKEIVDHCTEHLKGSNTADVQMKYTSLIMQHNNSWGDLKDIATAMQSDVQEERVGYGCRRRE